MTSSLLLLCLAAAAVVAYVGSGLSWLGLRFSHRWLESRTPAARARILRGLVLCPLVLTAAIMVAALAPSFGWIADHCGAGHDVHTHLHLCAHHQQELRALPVTLLACLFTLRCLWVFASLGVSILVMLRTRRALEHSAQTGMVDGVTVLPVERPQAFVLGIFWPHIFVTRGLLARKHRAHYAAVVAHERAHVERADSSWRLVARLAYAFHLPGVACRFDRLLARAHEMAADEQAAVLLGSRARIAEALVHMARSGVKTPRLAQAFGGSDVEHRVVSLLGDARGAEEPATSTLLALTVLGLTGIALTAETVHHGLEVVMGLFTG